MRHTKITELLGGGEHGADTVWAVLLSDGGLKAVSARDVDGFF